MPLPARTVSAIATVLVALASSAQAATRYVSNNGSDGPSHCLCGGQANPCRSISCAVHNAAAGDKVVVNPGSPNPVTVPPYAVGTTAGTNRTPRAIVTAPA